MKRFLCILLTLCFCLSLTGCSELLELLEEVAPEITFPQMTAPEFTLPDFTMPDFTIPDFTIPDFTVPQVTLPDITFPQVTSPQVTAPQPTITPTVPVQPTEPLSEHSELYIPGVRVEDVVEYFNEVCLDAEYVLGGDPTVLQKWTDPIAFCVEGDYTEEDLAVLYAFADWLNAVDGFPGMHLTFQTMDSDLEIRFCNGDALVELMGENFVGADGGATWWYTGDNVIYTGQIACRSDIDQTVRNSVILEEIYNSLGPGQDSWLREDSIIYAGYSIPQELSAVDELILRLLYHPDMKCGMNADECEAVIRSLYY